MTDCEDKNDEEAFVSNYIPHSVFCHRRFQSWNYSFYFFCSLILVKQNFFFFGNLLFIFLFCIFKFLPLKLPQRAAGAGLILLLFFLILDQVEAFGSGVFEAWIWVFPLFGLQNWHKQWRKNEKKDTFSVRLFYSRSCLQERLFYFGVWVEFWQMEMLWIA